ncbi:MAG: type VI secretion system tip protein TssI/VgrG, partial [Gammaproteobacteria bacterium]
HHFQLSGPPDEASNITKIIAASQNDRFTLIDVKYHIDALTSGFSCDIEAIQQGELVYPEATFPKINSLQTALVTGPANEEIHTDEHGRIKVQFHWDRHNQHDEHSSCWLRVMQSFAGPGFGAHFTPRIGQEVVIAFENGNPDRPFVLGALYHPENVPPYAEHNGTRAGLRTHSTKSTDASRYNELYFEDKLGAEEIYVQAERDHTHLVKHNLSTTVGNDKTQKIANNESTAVGKNAQRNIGDTYTVEAGNGIKIKAGNEITLEAGKEISLKVGGSTINLTSGKIEISGAVVLVKGNIALN